MKGSPPLLPILLNPINTLRPFKIHFHIISLCIDRSLEVSLEAEMVSAYTPISKGKLSDVP
jgi:hypothetical protein